MQVIKFSSVILILVGTSCGGGGTSDEAPPFRTHEVPTQDIPAPPDTYGGLSWLRNGVLASSNSPGFGPNTQIVLIDSATGDVRPLRLPDRNECRVSEYLHPVALANGELAITSRCVLKSDRQLRNRFQMLLIDPASSTTEPFVDDITSAAVVPSSWNASLTRGIGAQGDDTCSTLVWLSKSGVTYVSIELIGDGDATTIDATLVDRRRCSDRARAAWPSWSSKDQIAFFASPDSAGIEGHARIDVPWNLYVMTDEGERPRTLLSGIRYPRELAWSPDGSKLLFAGGFEDSALGIWLFDLGSHALTRISTRYAASLTWSPDGSRIAASFQVGGTVSLKQKLEMLDVRALV